MSKRRLIMAGLIGLIVLLLAVIGVLVWKYTQADKDPAAKGKDTSARVVQKVSELYIVPTSEKPTVALIQDKNKLGNQEFFKGARNGDYLLIYQKERIALVYREDVDKLVNVGPINIDPDQSTEQTGEGQTTGQQTDTPTP